LFNLVYADILYSSGIALLDDCVFLPSDDKVVGIAYADDLASLGVMVDPLQTQLMQLAESMLPYNLRANGGKTVLMIIVNTRRQIQLRPVPVNLNIFFENQWLARVLEFKYLGLHLDFMMNSVPHESICLGRARTAAIQIGKICRELGITDFSRLRTYFCSYVVSQFHGYQVSLFDDESYEQVLMLFFRKCFSLPVGYPRAIFYYFAGSLEFQAQQIMARIRFFQRVANRRGFMQRVMFEDRRLFLLGLDSWNLDFCSLYESFFRDRLFSELDLFDPVEAIRGDLERESLELREARLTLIMPSEILFRQLVTAQALPSFLRELSIRSHEETRLILIFFANMFRFCLFSRPIERCPMCLSNLNAPHFFDCPRVDTFDIIGLPRQSWRDLAERRDWVNFIDLFFFVGMFWVQNVPSIRIGHARTFQNGVKLFV
jgi:hypothetical protein